MVWTMTTLMSRKFLPRVLNILLVSVFTTGLLMVYLARSSDEETLARAARMIKVRMLEQVRQQRLTELQHTMFIHPHRPVDSTYNINVTLSELTPLERDVIDSRPAKCRLLQYDITKLASVTVIIPFYNEALSMLLRTVHSILRRTPATLLDEIIIIDDHSPNEDLKEQLAQYVRLLPKVRLVRTKQREGLIRARLIGARLAQSKVIMFQDAHNENNVQWLEPLLEEIRKNPKTIIQPHIDQLDPDTIVYEKSGGHVPRGGFSWDLR